MRPLLVAIVAAAAVAAAAACADSKKWKLKIKKNGITTKLKCGDLTTKKYSKYCSKKKKGKAKTKVKSACPKACGKCEKRADKSTPCADSATFEYKGTACADLSNVAESSKDLKEICREKGKLKLAAADACPEACGACPGDDAGGDEGDSGGDVGGDGGDSGDITTTTQVALGPGSCDADTFFDVFDAAANAVPADFCDRCCPGCAVHSGRAQLDFSAAAACVCYVGSVAGTDSAAMANLELSAHGDCAAVDGKYFDVRGNGGDDRLIVFGAAPGSEYSDYAAAVDGGDGDDFIDVRRSGYSVGGITERLVVAGGAGNDEISATGSLLQLDGGEDDDEIHLLSAGAVSSNNFVSGGGGNDVLDLEVSQSIVFGGDGNDAITVVGDDNDQIDGGAGTDDVRVTGDYNDDLNGGDGDGDKLTLRGKQGTSGEIEGFEIENLYPSRA